MHTHNHERASMAREIFAHPAGGIESQRGREDAIGRPPAAAPARAAAAAGFSARCKVKGCVYPVADPEAGICLHHAFQEQEPQFFQSRQPSLRMLERAKYGMTTVDEDQRIIQRREQQSRRRIFIEGAR